jgi:hypothetical protein
MRLLMGGVMRYKLFLLTLLVTTLAGCSPVKILNTESDEEFRLSNYKTFDFFQVKINNDTVDKPYTDNVKLLNEAITKELEEKGLKWNQDEPDLVINIGIVVQEKVQTRPTNFPNDAPIYVGQRRYSWKSQDVEVGKYKQGTVTVHLVDRILNKMVWRGVAEGVISANEKLLEKDIKQGMDQLFDKLKSPSKQ